MDAPKPPVRAYSHEAMVELIIANPTWTHAQLAAAFGKTAGWFAAVLASDSFQRALDPRRHEVADPATTATMEERMRALALRGMDVLQKKLDSPEASDFVVLKAAELGIKGLGLGQPKLEETPQSAGGVDAIADRLLKALEKQRNNVRMKTIEAEVVVVPDGQ